MRVTRVYLGKMVEIQWRDPSSGRALLKEAPKGRAALATWRERGVIDDITEGVVRLVHSAGAEAGQTVEDEIQWTAIEESLIERLTVYEPVKVEEGPSA